MKKNMTTHFLGLAQNLLLALQLVKALQKHNCHKELFCSFKVEKHSLAILSNNVLNSLEFWVSQGHTKLSFKIA